MVVDLFLVYQFIRRLATPFDKWDAYKEGVIDDKGNILIKKKDRDSKQKKAFGVFDVMVRNMKRILAKLPGGSTRLASYAAALFLIKEHKAFTEESLITEDINEDDLEKSLSLFSEAYLNYTTLDDRVNGFLSEKLKKSDDMGTWIKDFYDSDAPQFKGKSKAKRRQMAVAAKLDAERQDEACWSGYKQVGMKKKNGKDVPNCVPEELEEGAFKRIAQVQSNKADRMASNDKKGLDTYKKKPKTGIKEAQIDKMKFVSKGFSNRKQADRQNDQLVGSGKASQKSYVYKHKDNKFYVVDMKEDLDEAAAPRWKRAGPNGEIQATIGGKKYQIEKALDHNERHKGEWKVMVWDKRRNNWEWETTEYGKTNAKAWIMDKLQETPANNVGDGNIAGMDGGHMSKAAQKKWTSGNKSKKKKLRDMLGDKL